MASIRQVYGRGGTVDATDLSNLSALRETEGAELLKFGGTSYVAIPSQAHRSNDRREGVETRRAAPKASAKVRTLGLIDIQDSQAG
jgi:hypothetical protein